MRKNLNQLDKKNIPQHIAIIMDGNGRWAQKRNLPRTEGHRAGMEALHRVVEAASDLGVKYLTVYAFSTENWKRSEKEVNFLMDLAVEYFIKELKELDQKNVKVQLIGQREYLPLKVQIAALEMEEQTDDNTGLVLRVALNYGSRNEIVQAFSELLNDEIEEDQITEELVSSYLYTGDLPDPDLLIRTGGEQRLSNFLLWQLSYAEFIFDDILWPDCDRQFLIKMIKEYQNRNRRYGDVNEN